MSTATAQNSETHEEQLSRLRRQVNSLQDQLAHAQKLATVGTMAAMVAHEFNNILTPIINYARMARKNPALVDKALDRAAEGGTRATSICSALLGTVRDAPDTSEPASLKLLAQRTLEAMARAPEKDRIDLTIDVPEDLTTDSPVEVQQILLNLLLNARTAVLQSPGTRRIDISAYIEADGTVLKVADTGVGIPADQLEAIFEPFHSNSPADSHGQSGSGLGLAFCRRAVDQLGGNIAAASEPGCGATFTVRLPR